MECEQAKEKAQAYILQSKLRLSLCTEVNKQS
jgi:hypothetical protein